MKYNYSGPWPIFAVLGVVVFWVLFQVVALDASVGRAIASPINLFALMSAGLTDNRLPGLGSMPPIAGRYPKLGSRSAAETYGNDGNCLSINHASHRVRGQPKREARSVKSAVATVE